MILDNSSTHKTPEVETWRAKYPRFKPHLTPTSASWLNAALFIECIFSSVGELRSAIKKYIKVHNKKRQAVPVT
ncbi:IS3 family transposase [Halioxenophilus aromaticivorans]|uniref:IS3 family transposase n=1 Tax=Halioxenophilus aromaticivorans TaxID=1306992 RepID=UPI0036F369B3